MEFRYIDAVRAVYDWQYGNKDGFYPMLVHLYRKADGNNKFLIREGWPEIAVAVKAWEQAGDHGDDLFREYRIGRFCEPEVTLYEGKE